VGSGTAPNGECTTKRIAYRIAESAVRAAQYRMIYHHKEEYEVKAMCEFFGVSRAAYYAWEGRLGEPYPDQERMEHIQAVYETSNKSYGYRRITIQLQRKLGLRINHKAGLRLMSKQGIRSQARKPKMCKKLGEIGTYHLTQMYSIGTLSRQNPTRSGSRM